MSSAKISLNNQAFDGRLRQPSSARMYQRRPVVYARAYAAPQPVPTQPFVPLSQAITVAGRRLTFDPPPKKSFIERLPVRLKIDLAWMKQAKSFVAMAAILFVIGIGATINSIQTDRRIKAQVAVLGAASEVDDGTQVGDEKIVPTEQAPNTKAFKSYTTAADVPRYLRIPSINVDARVRAVGVMANGSMQVPSNVYDVGWYKAGAKPGDAAGAIVIDGHVHGPTLPGVFFGLKKLQPGNKINIERGDGSTYTFEVVKSQVFNKDAVDMNSLMVSVDTSKLGLNLITCTGAYDYEQKTYLERQVVYAVLK